LSGPLKTEKGLDYENNIVGLDDSVEAIDAQPASRVRKFLRNGNLLLETPNGTRYDATGKKVE